MKFRPIALLGVLLGLAANPTALRAEETYGKAADNKIYAEALVKKVKAGNSELIWAGIHAAAPGTTDYRIIASTMDLIGKKSDDNDIDVATDGRSHLTPNPKLGKIGVMMPLLDASGGIVGALGMAFRYHAGDDQAVIYTKATAIRNRLAKRIPDRTALFQATSE